MDITDPNIWLGFATLVVVFLLVIILGLEMKINAMARRIETKLNEVMKKT